MTNAVPIISIVSGAAVAILVPLITAATQSGQRREEHRRERLAAQRETLVKCCFDLFETVTAAVNAARRVGVDWPVKVDLPNAPDAESSYRLFQERLLNTYRNSRILILELGPNHEVVTAFDEALIELNGLQPALVQARSASPPEPVREEIARDLHAFGIAEKHFHRSASQMLIDRERRGKRVLSRLPTSRAGNRDQPV